MKLISSMGGCASTSLLFWFKKYLDCNCPINSEGLIKSGPGSNPKGLKHRIEPPHNDDVYLLKQNSFNRTDLNYGPIECAVFFYDSPLNIVPSLFNRKIAGGHAMAITGKRPPHLNSLDAFVNQGEDTFGFYEQFTNWSDARNQRTYKRMIVNASFMWDHLDEILGFLDIPHTKTQFPQKRPRQTSFESLNIQQRSGMNSIYNTLVDAMNRTPHIIVL